VCNLWVASRMEGSCCGEMGPAFLSIALPGVGCCVLLTRFLFIQQLDFGILGVWRNRADLALIGLFPMSVLMHNMSWSRQDCFDSFTFLRE
jgi:hypothetical protein